jgi:imidazolonepropionase-like amidohydrolase
MIDATTPRPNLRDAVLIACLMALGMHCMSAAAHDLRIEHVTIVSPERSNPLRDATVVIRDDRIVSLMHHSPMTFGHRSETGAEIINGSGLYLIPGLIDSHVHSSDLPGLESPQA